MNYSLRDSIILTASDEFYIAPSADVIGRVRLGHRSSIWFNCVLRADDDAIEIGNGSNVQDGTVIHEDDNEPVIIGENTSIGHAAIIHACRIGDQSLIGNGAIVLDGAVIGNGCIVAAGSLVTPRARIPDGSVLMGNPGKIVRQASEKDRALIERAAEHYRKRCADYRQHLRPQELQAAPRAAMTAR
jgi:carbonic anhydrase/acetyltransferase-like protein (isoleucine patch superfamily)